MRQPAPAPHTSILDLFMRPFMPADARFALMTDLQPSTRPIVFPDLDGLCRAIHRRRGAAGLELVDVTLNGWRDQPRAAVQIWRRDDLGQRERQLGFAWLDGRDRRALEAALYRQQPRTGRWAEAA